jgi:pyruvate dehydrogenase E1 component alpha subunit
LIEAFTYRRLMHTTADDPKRYRTDEEQRDWEDKDPLKRFRLYLRNRGIWTQAWEDELTAQAQEHIKVSVERAEGIGPLRPEDMFDNIFAERTPDLDDQLAYLKALLASREIEEDAVELKGGFP